MLKFHFDSSAIFDPQKGNQSVFTAWHASHYSNNYTKGLKNNGKVKKELNSPVTNQLSSHPQLKVPIKLLVGS